jgi:hypothetical protein
MPTPRQWFRDALADFRAARTGPRHDAQENGARAAFAADRAAAFRTFVDALPPVDADPTP